MAYKAHFLNVGCANCTIFEIGPYTVMIDCGYRRIADKISKPTNIYHYLKNEIDTAYIDLLIISHPHHDHYLGIIDLLDKITVTESWESPYKRRYDDDSLSKEELEEFNALMTALDPKNRFACTKDISKTLGTCTFTVLGPRTNVNDNETRECHDACLVIGVTSPANNFIICGDASDSQLDQIKTDWETSKCTVLHGSHHGSINGANLEFIKAVSPRDTLISTESGIIENLPHDTALQRYRSYSKNVFRTDTSDTCTAPLII